MTRSKYFLLSLALVCFSTFIVQAQTRQQREQQAAVIIDQELDRIFAGRYEQRDVVDIDSVVGNMRLFVGPVEDPYLTLKGCFVFFAGRKGHTSRHENLLGIYKNGKILWHSDTSIIGKNGSLFASRDINNDGTVDLVTQWNDDVYSPGYLWIFKWDGITGTQINANDDEGESVIRGEKDAFVWFDAEGDGVLEVRNVSVQDGSLTWSWNGNEYGSWSDTPHLPETTLFPRNKFEADFRCSVTSSSNGLSFQYSIKSKPSSKQRINHLRVGSPASVVSEIKAPAYWEGDFNSVGQFAWWRAKVMEHRGHILPGSTVDDFKLTTKGLPAVKRFFLQAYNSAPNPDLLTAQEYSALLEKDLLENSVLGYTLGPSDPPSPFVPINFLDTLISYKHQAFSLSWIKNQGVVTSLDQKLENAKQQLNRGNTQAAKNILEALLNEVEALNKEGNQLTSEAYALLKFNAEYLISKL